MVILLIVFIFSLIIIRTYNVYLFLKYISKICNNYDLKYINKHPLCAIDMIKDRDNYYMYSDWSAYNFLYLKGPSPRKIFFSFKKLTLNNFYNNYIIERLNDYEII